MNPLLRAAVLLSAGSLAAHHAAAQPTFRGLPPLPGDERSGAYAVSADGRFVTGYSYDEGSQRYRAVRWTAGGTVVDLGDLPGGADLSLGNGVSAHGFHLTGETNSNIGGEGFRWQGGSMTGLGSIPGGSPGSVGSAISADGTIIVGFGNKDIGFGIQNTAIRKVGGGPLVSLGYLTNGAYSAAQGVSADGSVVVGYSMSDPGDQAFRWTPAGGMVGLGDLSGGSFFSDAYGVSADGQVVVGQSASLSGSQAFRWTAAGGMVGLGYIPGGNNVSIALASSADGSLIVGYSSPGGDVAFMWDPSNGMRDFREVLLNTGIDGPPDWSLQSARGVSADGKTLVGIGTNPQSKDEAWIATLGEACTTATNLVSVSFDEQQGNGGSSFAAVTGDGNQIAFASSATNLVGGDTNAKVDVFVRNRSAGWTSRVSVSSAGVQGNNTSSNPAMSADGRYVVFESDATNLVAGDTNGVRDIFIRDRQLGTTARVSVSTVGAQGNAASSKARISADGRFVVYESYATNLVTGDTNGRSDVFLRDRQLNQTTRVSLTANGGEANGHSMDASVSDDGSIVCFASEATNLVAGDTNAVEDVFLRNRPTGATARVSVGTGYVQGNNASFWGHVSGNGRFFAFTTTATNLVSGDTNGAYDVCLRDRFNATTTRISMSPGQADGNCDAVAITGNGRYVVYDSDADNLVTGDTNQSKDVYIHDNWTFLTRRVSLGNNGQQAPGPCFSSAVSADGRYVVFFTNSANLVDGDTNGKTDIFLRDLCKP